MNKYDPATYPGFLQSLPIPSLPWTAINMDFIEGLSKSRGKTIIWVIVDKFTKYRHFLALSHSLSTQSLAPLSLDHILKLHGQPTTITSVRDPIFVSAFWQEFLSLQGGSIVDFYSLPPSN